MNKKLIVMSLASVIVSANQECFAEEITVTAEEVMNREDGINNTILKGINLNAPQLKDKLIEGNTIKLTIPEKIGEKQVKIAPRAFYGLNMNGASLELKFVGKVKFPQNCSEMFASEVLGIESPIIGIDFGDVDTSDVANMSCMFCECKSLTSLDLSTFKTEKVQNMQSMFSGCTNLKSLNVSSFNTENVTDMHCMFINCEKLDALNVSTFNTQNVTDMSYMFDWCQNLKSLNLSNFDTKNVTDMRCMFFGCNNLNSLDLRSFNTTNVTYMCDMFSDCKVLELLNVSSFNTQNVENMSSMFDGCRRLTSLDLRHFNTQNVDDMSYMFGKCVNLKSLNVSNFNTQNVENMKCMFVECKSLTSLDLRSFNTKNVKNMDYMFTRTDKLTSLTVNKNSFDNEALSQLPNNVKITDIAEKKQNENDKEEELKKALHAKRNVLNQIYWRIVANNAIVTADPDGEHGWIKNKDKYWKSIMEVIGKAIGDCVTGENEFANPTENELIVFEASPARYERKHWNAVFLYNYIKAKRDEIYDEYTGYLRPDYGAFNFEELQTKLYNHYEQNYNGDKNELFGYIDQARKDIQQYNEALGLEKVLEDFFSTAKEYDETDKTKRERREKLDKLNIIYQNYKCANVVIDWTEQLCNGENEYIRKLKDKGEPIKNGENKPFTDWLQDIITKKGNITEELKKAKEKYDSIIRKLQNDLGAKCNEIDSESQRDLDDMYYSSREAIWNTISYGYPRVIYGIAKASKIDTTIVEEALEQRDNMRFYPKRAPELYEVTNPRKTIYHEPFGVDPKNLIDLTSLKALKMPGFDDKYHIKLYFHNDKLKLLGLLFNQLQEVQSQIQGDSGENIAVPLVSVISETLCFKQADDPRYEYVTNLLKGLIE